MDSLVTDPPAGISFMGKDWDSDKGGRAEWIAWMRDVMSECLRMLKPGSHALVWAIPRTSHWTMTAMEEAGFEIRDVVTHLFGSGFPKSLDVSKAIDKAAGAEREVVSTRKLTGKARVLKGGNYDGGYEGKELNSEYAVTAPATDAAKQWAGFGTALKPACEFWILARKPLSEKTVTKNVERWGTGALNIDGCRIEGTPELPGTTPPTRNGNGRTYGEMTRTAFVPSTQGRFPANLVLSHDAECEPDQCSMFCAVKELDEQSGNCRSAGKYNGKPTEPREGFLKGNTAATQGQYADSGGASRFFYVAKPSRSERNAGCGVNGHPTVKPVKLMRYLCRLVTPPGGLVLDPFLGSGTTGVAAKAEGFGFVGIEREQEYLEIAKARIEAIA